MANTRTYDAQRAIFNGIQLGGLTRISVARGADVITQGQLDGIAGGQASLHRQAKFVRGTLACLDVTQAIALLIAAPANSDFYVKNSTDANYTQRTLQTTVFHGLSVRAGVGQKASMTLPFECTFGEADDWEDVDAADSTVVPVGLPDLITPVFLDAPLTATFDAAGTPVTIGHLVEFGFDVAGELVKDANPGSVGYDAVHFIPGTINFTLAFKDHVIVTGKDKVQTLLTATQNKELDVVLENAAGANKTFTLSNATFIGDADEEAARGFSVFRMNGRLDWADGAGLFHSLADPTNKMITIA